MAVDYVTASGLAARGYSKLVLITNGQRDIMGGINDFMAAATLLGVKLPVNVTQAVELMNQEPPA